MIFVRDKGRMCNNILQYGHLYAWGKENGKKTMSMRFAYKYRYFNIRYAPYQNFFVYLFAKYGCKLGWIPRVSFNEEGKDTYEQEQLMRSHKLIVAEGWYVSFPELFLKYKDEILRLFSFIPSAKKGIDRMFSQYDGNCLKLGVHIRRGDYSTWKNGRYLYSDKQYISIIQQFISLHPNVAIRIFICGNDKNLDKDAYINEFGEDSVFFPNGNPGEDLYMLSRCDYLIGAPSTFSLVASMYHDTPLYWIKDASLPLADSSFKSFDELFRNIE